MQRREFITLLGGGAVVWPLAVRAQQRNAPIVGILVPANPEPFRSEFQAGLRELGYREGQNIAFEFRSAEGNSARLRELADDLVRLKVDIIVAALTPAATAARQATTEIPIVMVSVGDPVATGLISSLARPGGNVTGLTSGGAELTEKTIELIREVLPSTKRVAALANAPDPFSKVFVDGVEDAGRKLGVAIQTIKVRGIEDFDAAFNAMVKEQAQAVIVQLSLPRKPIVDHALKSRLPLFGCDGSVCCSFRQCEQVSTSIRAIRSRLARAHRRAPISSIARHAAVTARARRPGDRVRGGMSAIGT